MAFDLCGLWVTGDAEPAKVRRFPRWSAASTRMRMKFDPGITDWARGHFRRAGLASWVFHAVVEGYEVDVVFALERSIVEVDG